ncbi:hypothetical protein HK096_009304, partial [Nowakowskiella sp. JEL0078]
MNLIKASSSVSKASNPLAGSLNGLQKQYNCEHINNYDLVFDIEDNSGIYFRGLQNEFLKSDDVLELDLKLVPLTRKHVTGTQEFMDFEIKISNCKTFSNSVKVAQAPEPMIHHSIYESRYDSLNKPVKPSKRRDARYPLNENKMDGIISWIGHTFRKRKALSNKGLIGSRSHGRNDPSNRKQRIQHTESKEGNTNNVILSMKRSLRRKPRTNEELFSDIIERSHEKGVEICAFDNFTLDIPSSQNIEFLTEEIERFTNVPKENQKLLFKNKPKVLEPESSLADSRLQNGSKITVIGHDVSSLSKVHSEVEKIDKFIGIMDQRRIKERQSQKKSASNSTFDLEDRKYRFFEITTLDGFSDKAEARKLLERLSQDVGIRAIMRTRRWSVGLLTELHPAERTILGYNQNMGQKIALRLRTDDLDGFRHYDSIRKVLLHELSH